MNRAPLAAVSPSLKIHKRKKAAAKAAFPGHGLGERQDGTEVRMRGSAKEKARQRRLFLWLPRTDGWHLLKTQGISRSLEIMRSGKEVSRQNSYIRELQDQGVYWVHSHSEFLEAVHSAGFEVREARVTFRGVSDFVVARKTA